MAKILITGSRSTGNTTAKIREALTKYVRPSRDTLIHGGAVGVDTIAEQWAQENGIATEIFYPCYVKYGKRAPLVRNDEMTELSDCTLAFWDGKSRGTKYTIDRAKHLLVIDL